MTEEEVKPSQNSMDEEDLQPLQQIPILVKDDNDSPQQCLVCYKDIVPDLGDTVKLPVEQLDDLVKVFQISVAPVRSDLPSNLFCPVCAGQIVDAVFLLCKIESLQNDFKVIKTVLQSQLMDKWVDEQNGSGITSTVDQVRKTLVEGLSRTESSTKGVSSNSRLQMDQQMLSQRPDIGDEDFEDMNDNSLGNLYSSATLNQEFDDVLKGRLRSTRRTVKSSGKVQGNSDEDYQPSDPEGVDSDDATSTPNKVSGRPSRRVTLKMPTTTTAGSDSKPNRYYYDKDKKLVGFVCPFCGRKMIREDYFTDSGNYVFKCFPDCCDKVLGNFPNLVVHHEASCLATPVDLYSKKRKVRTTPKSGKITKPSLATPVRTENPDILLLCPKSGTRVYDHNNKLTSFTCPFCERVLLKEDYSTDEGTYIFKCFPDCCDKITDNFNNLVAHHESFCPFKPQQLHSKKRRSARKSEEVNYNPTRSVKIEGTISGHSPAKRMRKSPTGSNLKSQPDNFTVSKSAHRVYDGNNKLFSFGCPFCRKLIMRDDYSVGAGKYVFKCLPECCGKIADNFSNLVAHHESFCPSKPKQLHSKRRQSHRKPGLGQGSNSSEKLVPMNQGFKYNAAHFVIGFKCPRCEKEFLPADFQTEDGSWVFKCPFESCEKVTTTFVNLAYHHGVHCSSKTAKKSTPKRSPSEKTEAVSVSPNAGVKPFACTRCPRKYKEQKALKFHMRLHYDEERTLKCSTCGESCEGRSKLNEHKRTHRAEYKSCPSCAKVFLNQQDLDNHIAKDHSNTSENDNSLESEELHVQGIS